MHPRFRSTFSSIARWGAAVTLFGCLLLPESASAGISACGDIDIEANAKCEVYVEAACVARCEPINFELSCSADLQAACTGSCHAELDLSCQESCASVCVPDCTLDPGSFDCQGECELDCGGKCDAYCAANPGQAHCAASCEAECSAKCSGRCDVELPTATCTERCANVCGASCEAEANLDCQVKCQATGFAQCESELQGGCELECQRPEGALFCDGQFVDHGGKLNECIGALNAYLKSHVTLHGSADAKCDETGCHAEAEAGIACSCTSTQNTPGQWLWALIALPGLSLVTRRRRA